MYRGHRIDQRRDLLLGSVGMVALVMLPALIWSGAAYASAIEDGDTVSRPITLRDVPVDVVVHPGGDVTVRSGSRVWVMQSDGSGDDVGTAFDRHYASASVSWSGETLSIEADDAMTTYRAGGAILGIAVYNLDGIPDDVIDDYIQRGGVTISNQCSNPERNCTGGGDPSTGCSIRGCGGHSGTGTDCGVTCPQDTYSCCSCLKFVGQFGIIYYLPKCRCCRT